MEHAKKKWKVKMCKTNCFFLFKVITCFVIPAIFPDISANWNNHRNTIKYMFKEKKFSFDKKLSVCILAAYVL